LKKFFVTVACLHPDLIPNDKVVWAPIPFDARHPQPGFRYMAVIDILEVVVVSPGSPPPAAARLRLLPVWWGRGGASSASVGLGWGLVSLRRARVGPRRLLLGLPVGALLPYPSGTAPLPPVLAPGWRWRARLLCLAPRWFPHCPRRAPVPTRNGGCKASTHRRASSAACWVPRRSALSLAPRPVGRRWGVGRPRSRPLRLLGPPPRILRGGLPLTLRRWRFAPGAERSRLRRSVLLVALGLQGRLLLHAGRALQEWTYRSSTRVWGLSRWSVWWGRHPLCLYLRSWPLRSSRSS
jgi:hypothetical protein